MYRIIDKRGKGKTSRLLLLAKEMGATVVCSNPRALQYKAQSYGLNGIEFISYDEYLDYDNSNTQKRFLVDEIDGLLQSWDGNIIGYCETLDD